MQRLDEDIGLALGNDKDDLARFAIRRLLPRRAEVKALAVQIAKHAEEAEALAARAELQQTQLEALRVRVRAELARERHDTAPAAWDAEPVVADEDVELELMRRRTAGGQP